MKILAKGPGDTFIITATDDELSNLLGFHSGYNRRRSTGSTLNIGDDIKVAPMFRQLYDLSSKKKELEAMRGALMASAELLNIDYPIVEAQPEKGGSSS